MTKTAKEYLRKPYSRVLIPEEDGTYSADILEFPGCFAEGKTPNEAYTNLERVAESWIEAALEQGQEIPEPIETHEYSGRIALRLPKSIHKQAAKFAEMDNTSLNQFFLSAIATKVGAGEFFEQLFNKLEDKLTTMATTLSSCTASIKVEAPMQYATTIQMSTQALAYPVYQSEQTIYIAPTFEKEALDG